MSSPLRSSVLSSNSPLSPPPRSASRSSSRTSLRSGRHSPSVSLDDPVALRQHLSTLKHSIRQQQAQLHKYETELLRGPRPLPPEIMSPSTSPTLEISFSHSSSSSSPPSAFSPASPATKLSRRNSYDALQEIAGPESSLPLPLPRNSASSSNLRQDGGIREGIPMDFGVGSATPTHHKRVSSPTRTLSRIPVSSVGNARALADEGQDSGHHGSSSLHPPPSPSNGTSPSSKRLSLTPGGTTKVLADLQTGVMNARNALENTKAQLRLSQRTVATLTRQTEDMKEARERLRLENEGLNNVVARKERLLQEAIARARKAEEERDVLKAQLKTETSTAKKSLREMESQLSEATALSQRRDREYVTLRDSLASMKESWKADTNGLREEMKKREERWRKEAENMGKKYRAMVEECKKAEAEKMTVKQLMEEHTGVQKEIEQHLREEIERLKGDMEKSGKDGEEALKIAQSLSMELARLRRLMQAAGRGPSSPTDSNTPIQEPPAGTVSA
ncbi:hypothetical protein PUNSTDRAFT_109006 [Punctularia strigosozonata HHB-11173 SS5]|uniref:SWI5-dependent HO expression protein 3 n=1 Tax=Punctularia strigosozonata (strain HHB-11173) TaxID=741275 RepID=R7S249_PUNST|nr:uncharacterized protein PUNSTDRAFT_109006 [Punctularia strigosozonata HHB-11173 SS5]EIN03857.1 hypothetical protein PUNSTDRAFT_109006 [Punctularia strigosozonata HHB-11173 SS5]